MPRLLAIAPALLLAACVTTPEPVIEVRTVNVAVPVPCREAMPARPELDAFVAAAIAEIELREGYEGQLKAALQACIE